MKVLVVGAGATGQVYGHHLELSGDNLTFFVKPKYKATVSGPLSLIETGFRKQRRHLMGPHQVIDSIAQVAAERWDEVWLAVSATAITGSWLHDIIAAARDAVIVSLQPGFTARTQLLECTDASKLVTGAIAFLAWQTPLPGDTATSIGIQYWLPPLARSQFSGPTNACSSIVKRLNRGGCPAQQTEDAAKWAAIPSAIMMPHIAGLELESWSLTAFYSSNTLRLSITASCEAIRLSSAHFRTKMSLIPYLLRPAFMRIFIRMAQRWAPFNLEAYLAYHFSKVGDQTRELLGQYIETAAAADLPSTSIESLRDRLLVYASGLDTDR